MSKKWEESKHRMNEIYPDEQFALDGDGEKAVEALDETINKLKEEKVKCKKCGLEKTFYAQGRASKNGWQEHLNGTWTCPECDDYDYGNSELVPVLEK